MKPKVYRKTKKTGGTKNKPWTKNKGGGTVNYVEGPLSSVGSNEIGNPRVEQGNDIGGTNVSTS